MQPLALQLGLGALLAYCLAAFARGIGCERLVFAVGLAIAAGVYVVAALAAGGGEGLLVEIMGLVLFGIVAFLGFRYRPDFLAYGWAAHVLWDVLLHTGARSPIVPAWYAMLCVGLDLLLGGYILGRLTDGERAL
ncbi:MAG: DUF6010 family protein [Thermoanaerobaculia bacterium]